MKEWMVRRRAATDAVKAAAIQRRQHRLEGRDVLLPAYVDMDVELAVKIKADRGIARADLAQHGQEAGELIGEPGGWMKPREKLNATRRRF